MLHSFTLLFIVSGFLKIFILKIERGLLLWEQLALVFGTGLL